MRVKSAGLKARLSHYLRLVHGAGEEIEVCIREKPFAYMTRAKEPTMNAAEEFRIRELEAAFRSAGLTLAAPVSPRPAESRLPTPGQRHTLKRGTTLPASEAAK
jgi:antitoxin (DNA-binding transcriptional repressor) of toxin-antitoxin stability system